MGRMILHIDILEILSLAWDHPLVTGALVLMFTPPLFPVLVFFSPLLISTALCVVALISVGHQIEGNREREIAGWNARVVDGDRLRARLPNARNRNRVAGEESWLEWVQGLGDGSAWSNSEGNLMDDIKEEGLKADFRADEGGIEFMEEDYLDRQIEAFREYERSFSFRTGARAGAAGIAVAASNAGALPGVAPSSMEMVPFPTESNNNKGVSTPQIPPIFLYNLRTGGTGSAGKFDRGAGVLPSGAQTATAAASGARIEAASEPLPFGSFDMSGIIDAVERATRDEQRYPEPEHQRSMFEKGRSAAVAAESQVSPVGALMNMNNFAEKKVPLQSPIKLDQPLEGEFMGFTTTVFEEKDSPKSLLVSQSPVVTSTGVVPAVKPSEESLRTLTYNGTLRLGNAVIYNASSDSGRAAAALERQGSGAVPRKHSTNRGRRVSTTTRQIRHLPREKSSKDPFQLDFRTLDDLNQMKSSSPSNR